MGSSAVLAGSGGEEKLRQLLLGVVIRAVHDCAKRCSSTIIRL